MDEQQVPPCWEIVGLNEVAALGPKVDVSDLRDEQMVHFVPMAAVSEDFGGIDTTQLRPLSEVRKGYTSFAEGDILFAKITPCMENGKGGVVPTLPHGCAFGSTEFHVIRPHEAVTSSWLAHFLSQPVFRRVARQNMTGSAGQLRVPTKWLASVKTPVPPLPEQTRIVAKLEELLSDLDAGVAELKAAQAKLAQYRQSLLKAAVEGALTADWRARHTPQETGAQLLARILTERRARWEARQLARFQSQGKTPPKGWQGKYPEPAAPDTRNLPELPKGWVWASLDQLVAESSYGTSTKCGYDSPGTPVLRIPNIGSRRIDLQDMKFSLERLDLDDRDFLTTGDVLVIRTNGSVSLVGRAAAVTEALKTPHYFASYLLRLRSVETQSGHRWMTAWLSSHFGRRWLEARAASSAGQHNISLSTLLTMPVALPPLSEQAEALNLLESALGHAEDQKQALAQSLKQSTAQRQNLFKAAFSGQLVPQDPADEPASVLLERIRAQRATPTSAKKAGSNRRSLSKAPS